MTDNANKNIGMGFVPIVPDEARTFGMEALFQANRYLLSEGSKISARGCRSGYIVVQESKEG